LKRWLFLFLLSMVPVIELRGAVPIGMGWGFPFWAVLLVSFLGNIVPVPFVILFGNKILPWCATWPVVGGFFRWVLDRGRRKAAGVTGAIAVALYFFVAIPLPGTGAWTGSLVAMILGIPLKKAFPAIAAGVITAGIIMGITTFGVLSLVI